MGFTMVTVTGTLRTPEGAPAAGYLKFTPTAPMNNAAVIVADPIRVDLDEAGTFNVLLAATDDEDTSPVGVTYRVLVRAEGAAPAVTYLNVPHTASTVDLDDAVPVLAPPHLFPTSRDVLGFALSAGIYPPSSPRTGDIWIDTNL